MIVSAGQAALVPINGINLNVRVDGPEHAPWMVCSNSLASNMALWDDFVAAFGRRFRFLRYDQRGHGRSDSPAGKFTMDDLADDLLRLIDYCGVDKATLVGVSMGATTVLRCAARDASRCLAVVPVDGVAKSAPGSAAMWEERFAIVRAGGMRAMAEPTVRRWFQPDFFDRKPEIVERTKTMIAGTKPEGYFGCATALQEYDFSADIPALAVPALYIVGAQDGDTPAAMKTLADATPDGRYHVIDHCGHLPVVEQPEAFFAAVDTFVRELGIA